MVTKEHINTVIRFVKALHEREMTAYGDSEEDWKLVLALVAMLQKQDDWEKQVAGTLPSRHGARWSSKEESILVTEWLKKEPIGRVAKRHERTPSAVIAHLWKNPELVLKVIEFKSKESAN